MQENALYTITNGLYVLSVQDGEGYAGSLVDAVSQIAVSPYLIMVSCMNNSHTKSCIEKAGEFGISVLAKETDPFVVANFGYQSSRDVKKVAEHTLCGNRWLAVYFGCFGQNQGTGCQQTDICEQYGVYCRGC